MPPEPQHHVLGAWIRDPERNPPPEGVEARRLAIYADLFHRNVEGLLAAAFPVIAATLGDLAWQQLVRDFIREHPARTPLFAEVSRELLRYLDTRADDARGDPAWLRELAHYEWVELALQVSDAQLDDGVDPMADLLATPPVLSPLAWPLAYEWPVHRIGPGSVPERPPAAPTLLLVRRIADGTVQFSELSPLAFRLLQRLEAEPHLTGRDHLRALAVEACATTDATFMQGGAALLQALRGDGTIAGGRPVIALC